MEEIEQMIYQATQKINWWIEGMGQHGLSVKDINMLTPERMCELYNVHMSYFFPSANKYNKYCKKKNIVNTLKFNVNGWFRNLD